MAPGWPEPERRTSLEPSPGAPDLRAETSFQSAAGLCSDGGYRSVSAKYVTCGGVRPAMGTVRYHGGMGRPRDRILTAATDLFYRCGINATGIAEVAGNAGVSKRTLYQLFPSKDLLVAAYLA